jgi:hypothetical protein
MLFAAGLLELLSASLETGAGAARHQKGRRTRNEQTARRSMTRFMECFPLSFRRMQGYQVTGKGAGSSKEIGGLRENPKPPGNIPGDNAAY